MAINATSSSSPTAVVEANNSSSGFWLPSNGPKFTTTSIQGTSSPVSLCATGVTCKPMLCSTKVRPIMRGESSTPPALPGDASSSTDRDPASCINSWRPLRLQWSSNGSISCSSPNVSIKVSPPGDHWFRWLDTRYCSQYVLSSSRVIRNAWTPPSVRLGTS